MKRLQQILKARRAELGLTQKVAHQLCNWGKRPEYKYIEREQFPATDEHLRIISQALDVDLSEFYSDRAQSKPETEFVPETIVMDGEINAHS